MEAAHDTVDELGKLGVIQFNDVSELFILLRSLFGCSFEWRCLLGRVDRERSLLGEFELIRLYSP